MLLGRFIGDFVEYMYIMYALSEGDFPTYILCWYTLYPCSTKIMMGGVPADSNDLKLLVIFLGSEPGPGHLYVDGQIHSRQRSRPRAMAMKDPDASRSECPRRAAN